MTDTTTPLPRDPDEPIISSPFEDWEGTNTMKKTDMPNHIPVTGYVRAVTTLFTGDDPALDPDAYTVTIDTPWHGKTAADILRDDRYRECRSGREKVRYRDVAAGLKAMEVTTVNDWTPVEDSRRGQS